MDVSERLRMVGGIVGQLLGQVVLERDLDFRYTVSDGGGSEPRPPPRPMRAVWEDTTRLMT
jgi:hypothetical protein